MELILKATTTGFIMFVEKNEKANATLSCIQSNETTTDNIAFAKIPFRTDALSSELFFSFQPVAVIKSKQPLHLQTRFQTSC